MEIMKRRELDSEEKAEAERLSAAWANFKAANKGVTQEWLGAETGLGTQGAVGQYLRGVIPLNIEALMAFSRVLEIDPKSVSTRLTKIVEGLLDRPASAGLADSMKLSAETADELRLLTSYRIADEKGKIAFHAVIERVLERAEMAARKKA